MARPLRLEFTGALYHITSRGNARNDIYQDDEDRVNWLELLNNVCDRFNWICHAYCLMDNHYHVVVETVEGNLSKGMRQLNGVYTQTFNRRHHRVGHVFQGRYKAILVEKDSYLLELSRYVVLNPVRARMVKDVADWPWSSYLATMNQAPSLECLQVNWLLAQFGSEREKAIIRYQNFVRAGIGLPPVWEKLKSQIFLGNEGFVEKLQAQIKSGSGNLAEIPKAQRRPLAEPLNYYVKAYSDRKKGMRIAYETGNYTLQQIADCFGVHYLTVSRAMKQVKPNNND